MNPIKLLFVCSLALPVAAGLQACHRQTGDTGVGADAAAAARASSADTLRIAEWGPRHTRAGVAFNAQPSGIAAIWIRMNQSLDGATAWVQFDDAIMQGHVSDHLVTSVVPAALYDTPGTYAVRVIVRKGDVTRRSNKVMFTVQ